MIFSSGFFVGQQLDKVHFGADVAQQKIDLKSLGSFGLHLTNPRFLKKSARDLKRTSMIFSSGFFVGNQLDKVHVGADVAQQKIDLKSLGSFGLHLTNPRFLKKSARDLKRTSMIFSSGFFVGQQLDKVHFGEI